MAASSVPQQLGAPPTSSSVPVQIIESIDTIVQRLKLTFPNITFVFGNRMTMENSLPKAGDICRLLIADDNSAPISKVGFCSLRDGKPIIISDSTQEVYCKLVAQLSTISDLSLVEFFLLGISTHPNKLFDILTTGISLKRLTLSYSLIGQGFCEFLAASTSLTELILTDNNLEEVGWMGLAANSTLTVLNLSSNYLGDVDGAEIGRGLAANSTLKLLDLSHNKLGDASGAEIGKGLAANSTLTQLNLYNNQLGEIGGMEIGKGLAVNSALLKLNLSSNELGEVGGTEIGKALAANSTLTELNLSSNPLGEAAGSEIGKALAANSTLTELNLSSNQLGEAAGSEIGKRLAVNSALLKLNLSSNELGEVAGLEIGKVLAANSTLTELNLSANQLGEAAGSEIAKALVANSSLAQLDLSANQLGEVSGMAIGNLLVSNSSLTMLKIYNNRLGMNSGMAIRKGLAANTTLTVLHLSQNDLGAVGGIDIGRALVANSSLTQLDLSHNQLGDLGVMLIGEGLAANSTLTQLDLSYNELSYLREIGKGLAANSALTVLNLSWNMLEEDAGKKIGKALTFNSTLTELNLAHNQLGEVDGVEIGKGLAVNSTLTKLNLSYNQIGTLSFRMIVSALCNSPLQRLDVHHNAITTIPPSLADSRSLTTLIILNNPLIEPTSEFVRSASLGQLKAYLRAPRVEILRVRLSVVGYHGVGKTTLTTHLLHPEIQSQMQLNLKMQELKLNGSTHGIKTHLLQIPCAELGGKTIKFNTFDFAGQPIYYSNHRHFLGQHRVVHLIVFKATDSTMEAEQQVNHWCNLIASQIDHQWRALFESDRLPKPSVIVIGSHLNLCKGKEPPIDHEVWFEEFIQDGFYASVFDIHPELLWIDHDAPESISNLLALIVKNGVTQLRNFDSTSASVSSSSSSFSSQLDSNFSFYLSSHPEIVSRALSEIDRIRSSNLQWRLFYTLEDFQNTLLLGLNNGDDATVRQLVNDIGIDNLAVQMQAMGEVVYLREAKKICIEPQRVFDLLADFVHRHNEGSRDDVKQFVDHHMGLVSADALRTVCTRYNLEIRRKFKQQCQVLTLEVLIETLIDFDLCIKMASGEYLFPSLLPSDSTREMELLNKFYSHSAPRFDIQWQIASQNKRVHEAFIPSIMFGTQIDCYRNFPAPRFILESWPTGILIKTDEGYKIMIAMIPEMPGGIRFSIQVDLAVIDHMTEFMKQIKKALKLVFYRVRSSMFRSTSVVGLCRYCSDLKVVPDERLHPFFSLDSDFQLETHSVDLKHPIGAHNQRESSFIRSTLPLTPLRLLIELYRANNRLNQSQPRTSFFFCSQLFSFSPDISDSPFHHPEFIRFASYISQDLPPPNSNTPSQPPTCSSSNSHFDV